MASSIAKHTPIVTTSGETVCADAAVWQPTEEDTVFDLASVSKLFTSIAAVQLIEDGRVELEAPVAAYLPEFAANGKLSDESYAALAKSHNASREQPDLPSDDEVSAFRAARVPHRVVGGRKFYERRDSDRALACYQDSADALRQGEQRLQEIIQMMPIGYTEPPVVTLRLVPRTISKCG